MPKGKQTTETAVFGGGCFWCTEAVFAGLRGVESATPGYAGGTKPNPSYEEVCGGKTGHAEVAKIVFNPSVITFEDLLTVFFNVHDPTELNRQGNDVGTQYRSVIFYASPEQKRTAETFIRTLAEGGAYDRSIVTEVKPLGVFYPAEDYHKQYYERNKNAPYCELVIAPKLEKVQNRFAALLKRD